MKSRIVRPNIKRRQPNSRRKIAKLSARHGELELSQARSIPGQQKQNFNQHIAVTPATESTRASFASF
jgi:hypothetical protein